MTARLYHLWFLSVVMSFVLAVPHAVDSHPPPAVLIETQTSSLLSKL
mgnify:CR=1 FL=1